MHWGKLDWVMCLSLKLRTSWKEVHNTVFKSLNGPIESGQFDVGQIFQREKQRSWMNWDQFVYKASWDQLTAYCFYHHHQVHPALYPLLWGVAPLPCSPSLYACWIPCTLLLHRQVVKLTNWNIRLQKAFRMTIECYLCVHIVAIFCNNFDTFLIPKSDKVHQGGELERENLNQIFDNDDQLDFRDFHIISLK